MSAVMEHARALRISTYHQAFLLVIRIHIVHPQNFDADFFVPEHPLPYICESSVRNRAVARFP